MKILFGLDLDGHQALATQDTFGKLICGPHALLEFIELRLGLATKSVSAASRIAHYRELLERMAVGQSRFYASSFERDPFSVAETLLRWRDELVLAGWDGSAHSADSKRICDLADVEKIAVATSPLGFGDRVRVALAELDRRGARLHAVEVIDSREHIPPLLRQLLAKLGATFGLLPSTKLNPAGSPGTDLWKIQRALAHGSETRQIKLAHDGSVIFVTAFSEVTLAQITAQVIQESRRKKLVSTIIAQSDCLHLDTALRALDEPTLALSPHSTKRPILQTLALALRLRWEPLDPRDLLEFLMHPVAPMERGLRARLARVVAEFPGIGGREWNRVIAEHEAFLKQKFASDSNALQKALEKFEADLLDWVNFKRFDPLAGAPVGELVSTCARVAHWATARASDANLPPAMTEQYGHAAAHASELATILKTLPVVTRAQLDRLLDQVIGDGVRCNDAVAEAGHAYRLIAPGAILEPADTVLWWDFRASPFYPPSPWTSAEIQQLKKHGTDVLRAATRLARENAAALRPVIGTRHQLIFLVPRHLGNEAVHHHPLHDRIQSLVYGKLPIFDLDQHLADPAATPAPASVAPTLSSFPRRQLPAVRRWWKLPDGHHLGPIDLESFTSAAKFIYSPYAWVLEYKARLKAGVLFGNQIVHDNRQRGNLLHRLIELIFTPGTSIQWTSASQVEVNQWLEAAWQKLLPAEGANLLLPGYRAVADTLFAEAKRAIWWLIEHLRAASITKATVNVSPPKLPFIGGKLGGYIDLVVESVAGRSGIIDIKYSGYRRKRAELANNLQLQLAIYGCLVAQRGAWPESAFFILTRRSLLTQNRNFFPSAEIVASKLPQLGLKACWREFEEVWRWRRGLLEQGWIELTIAATQPTDGTGPEPNSSPPIDRWQAKDEDRFNDFDALTGWEEKA